MLEPSLAAIAISEIMATSQNRSRLLKEPCATRMTTFQVNSG